MTCIIWPFEKSKENLTHFQDAPTPPLDPYPGRPWDAQTAPAFPSKRSLILALRLWKTRKAMPKFTSKAPGTSFAKNDAISGHSKRGTFCGRILMFQLHILEENDLCPAFFCFSDSKSIDEPFSNTPFETASEHSPCKTAFELKLIYLCPFLSPALYSSLHTVK